MSPQEQLNFPAVGRLYVSVLEQDKVWRDASGRTHELDTMDPEHRTNIVPFLRRHGEHLRWSWLMNRTRQHGAVGPTVLGTIDGKDVLGPDVPLFSDNGGNLDGAFDDWMDWEMARPFEEWLADRPLVKRLQEITGQR